MTSRLGQNVSSFKTKRLIVFYPYSIKNISTKKENNFYYYNPLNAQIQNKILTFRMTTKRL